MTARGSVDLSVEVAMASSQEATRHSAHKKSKKKEIDKPVTFVEVLRRERERLNKSRGRRQVSPPAPG